MNKDIRAYNDAQSNEEKKIVALSRGLPLSPVVGIYFPRNFAIWENGTDCKSVPHRCGSQPKNQEN